MSAAAVTAAEVDWYFDFISPYSYLAFEALPAALAGIEPAPMLRYRPVLFAGLLNHWGHMGPAEVPPKRRFTYEHCAWLANRHGIPMRAPRQHPFNPLPLLRAAIAAGCGRDAIGRLFRFVWRDGSLPGEPAFAELLRDLAVTPQALDEAPVKDALRANGEEAIAAGVFGVPTAVAHTTRGVRAIWGFESLPMLTDWLRDAPVFGSEEMRRAADLPMGEQRRSFGR
ncbi:MAG: DsbA family protein [Burkholderiales bacterium]|jgi:2-hydroxychromene-2-carboxylate isomerase|nr:DsbA family protein [Burkholderiales bacterium]